MGVCKSSWDHFRHEMKVFTRLRQSIMLNLVVHITANLVMNVLAVWVVLEGVETGMEFHLIAGIGVGFLLVFRSNKAYDRFWEARGDIGETLANIRAAAILCASQIKHPELLKMLFHYLALFYRCAVVSFRVMAASTYGTVGANIEDPPFLSTETEKGLAQVGVHQRPYVILRMISSLLNGAHQKGLIEYPHMQLLVGMVTKLSCQHTATTKICSTNVPFPYQQLCTWLVSLYCYTSPFVFATAFAKQTQDPFGVASRSCIASSLLGVCFFGINCTACELEDPFGEDENDLPLHSMGDSMAADLALMLTQVDGLPQLVKAMVGPPVQSSGPGGEPEAQPNRSQLRAHLKSIQMSEMVVRRRASDATSGASEESGDTVERHFSHNYEESVQDHMSDHGSYR